MQLGAQAEAASDGAWLSVLLASLLPVLLIGASAGDFIPGQIGALEGAFSFFAAAIGTTPPNVPAGDASPPPPPPPPPAS